MLHARVDVRFGIEAFSVVLHAVKFRCSGHELHAAHRPRLTDELRAIFRLDFDHRTHQAPVTVMRGGVVVGDPLPRPDLCGLGRLRSKTFYEIPLELYVSGGSQMQQGDRTPRARDELCRWLPRA